MAIICYTLCTRVSSGYAPWIAPTLIIFCIFATPVWGYIAARNPFTKEVLDYGWTPVISAMLISR
jgi:solute carrier family 41